MSDLITEIKGHTLEYIDDIHCYIVDGIIVPSISKILAYLVGNKYARVDANVLARAAQRGTVIHSAIEHYAKTGECADMKEVQNFMFLQKHYGFDIYDSERPMILFKDDIPVACGRCDLVLTKDGKFIGADVKTSSKLDKDRLAYQLNLYRIAYRQSYDIEWSELKGIHLKDDTRRYVDIPIIEDVTMQLLNNYLEENK